MSQYSKQAGSIMIESLVTIVIVSFGLLGIVGLLISGMSSANMSQMRTTAVMLANEIAEDMRANQTGVTESIKNSSGYIVNDNSSSAPSKICKPVGVTTVPDSCAPLEMAAHDIYEWKNKIESYLPNGKGKITRSGTTNSVFDIQITWLEDKANNSSMNFKLRFEP